MLLNTAALMAENGTEAPPQDYTGWQTIILVVVFILFFYLIMWRPEQKRRKELETQRNDLKKGDKVTAMGIIGTITKVEEHTVVLKMIDGSKIQMLKAAVSEVVPQEEESSEE